LHGVKRKNCNKRNVTKVVKRIEHLNIGTRIQETKIKHGGNVLSHLDTFCQRKDILNLHGNILLTIPKKNLKYLKAL
jgi:hypothetical protein